MPNQKYTQFTYLGMTKEQKKAYAKLQKAQYEPAKPAPNIPDETPKMSAAQREMAKIRFEAGIEEAVSSHKEAKPFNDKYIDQKVEGKALVVNMQGLVMKAGEPVWIKTEKAKDVLSQKCAKMRGLIQCAEDNGKPALYKEGPTVEAPSLEEAPKVYELQQKIAAEKAKQKESKK